MASTPPAPPRRRMVQVAAGLLVAALLVAGLILTLAGSHGSSPRVGGETERGSGATSRRPSSVRLPTCGTVCAPIDAAYLTDLRFGNTSLWLQPWRAYFDTWPAARLIEALDVNFNAKPSEAQSVARLLHEAGFKLARIGLNWGAISYSDPSRFDDEAGIRTRLEALHRSSLRPLILLDANSGAPAPHEALMLRALTSTPVGSSTIALSPQSAAQVAPGRTGIDSGMFNSGFVLHRHGHHDHLHLSHEQRHARHLKLKREEHEKGLNQLLLHGNPAILITHVSSSGLATLSRPLPRELPAGALKAVKLRYAPFGTPTLEDGSPNAQFHQTLAGWVSYVRTVCRLASSIFGSGGFDLEVWNELSFGSQFLDAGRYYAHAAGSGKPHATREVTKAILRATVDYVRSPQSGLSSAVGVTNGFASQTPFATGEYAPPGLTAISKHPYHGLKIYPEDFVVGRGHIPLNALGERDTAGPRGSEEQFTPLFVPRMRSFFPEFYLTAETPDTLVRDISPVTTHIYGARHGRHVHAAGRPPVQVWVTEYNLGSKRGEVVGPDGYTALPGATFTTGDAEHFQTKVVLRSLVSMIGKGVAREYFYAAVNAGDLGLIPHWWHGQRLSESGETLQALARMLARFSGPGPQAGARPLVLSSITQRGDHAQFVGAGTVEHPSLLDREVLLVQPFQSAPGRFVIPYYVMTRDLKTDYAPSTPRGDRARFDLPDETFDVTLANMPSGAPTVHAYDPITGDAVPVAVVHRHGTALTIRVSSTDYPRLLELEYR